MNALRRVPIARRLVYGSLCILIVVAIIAKCVFWHRVSQYQKGKNRLEMILQNDERFRSVRIFFFSTRPSVSILAPRDLPLRAKQDLELLVNTAFAPLSVPVNYAGSEFFDNTNEGLKGKSNQVQNGDPIKQP